MLQQEVAFGGLMPLACSFGIPICRELKIRLTAGAIFKVDGDLKLGEAVPAFGCLADSLRKIQTAPLRQ
jgi:hypothetical protein